MYHRKFVAVIKVHGRVLRENNGKVAVPFGSEYSILLKNLNSVRVMAKISIDGQDATEGTWLVLGPNSNSEIERFIKNGNLNAGNRFKFIERSPAVEQHRGIGAEDGLVRIEFKTERVQPVYAPPIIRSGRRWSDYYKGGGPISPSGGIYSLNEARSTFTCDTTTTGTVQGDCGVASAGPGEPLTECAAGITVAGGVSNQQFHWTESFPVIEPGEVIVFQLVGTIDGQQVTQPVTVDHKPACTSCGRINRPNSQFCAQCGTSLTLV